MGYILDGKYHKGQPNIDQMTGRYNATFKQHDHNMQRADHARDIVQPYKRDGSVNEDFIKAFPVESKEVYNFLPSDQDLKNL